MSRPFFDAMFGRMLDDGEELEFRGGTNFIGFVIEADEAEDVYNITPSLEGAAAPGDDTQVIYNSADALAAAAGVTIVDGGNGLQVATYFRGPSTVGPDGVFRVANDVGGYTAANAAGSASVLVGGYVDSANGALYNRGTGAYVAPANTAWYNAQSGVWYWRVHNSGTGGADHDVMALSDAGLALGGRLIDGFSAVNQSLLNGAAPVAPVEGTVLADANANIVATDGSQIRIPTLTADRTYDINNTSAIDEETITLYRTGTEAFTATIRDAADATIATFPASTKLAGVFRKATGGNFVHVGWQRIG